MAQIPRDELIANITRHRNFAGLGGDDLNVLLDVSTVQTWTEGEVLFTAGDPLDGGYVLITGRVEQEEEPYPGRRLHRQSFASGSLFGVGGFIKGWTSRRTCRALEDTAVLFVDRGAFLRQIEACNPAAFRIVDALLDLYVQDVQDVNDHLDEIYNRPNETLAILRHHAEGAGAED